MMHNAWTQMSTKHNWSSTLFVIILKCSLIQILHPLRNLQLGKPHLCTRYSRKFSTYSYQGFKILFRIGQSTAKPSLADPIKIKVRPTCVLLPTNHDLPPTCSFSTSRKAFQKITGCSFSTMGPLHCLLPLPDQSAKPARFSGIFPEIQIPTALW